MTTRAMPYHCPYCADEDLRPHGETHGAWECRSCLRAFSLKFIGQLSNPTPTSPEPGTGTHERRTAP